MKKLIGGVLLVGVLCGATTGYAEDRQQAQFWDDAHKVAELAGRGFTHQFKHEASRNALIFGGIGTAGTAFADNKLSDVFEDVEFFDNNIAEVVGDQVTVAMGFVPLVAYGLSYHLEDEKLRSYSLETLGALSLAYSEVVLLSQLPTHERPRFDGTEESGFFNSALRGKYSWPSGHMVAPTMITLKTWDYYGWKAAMVPATIGAVSTASRLGGGWHYASDMVAAVALSVSAHWATRDLLEEKEVHLGVQPLEKGLLVRADWSF